MPELQYKLITTQFSNDVFFFHHLSHIIEEPSQFCFNNSLSLGDLWHKSLKSANALSEVICGCNHLCLIFQGFCNSKASSCDIPLFDFPDEGVLRMFFISQLSNIKLVLLFAPPANPAPARLSAPTAPWVTALPAPLVPAPLGLTKDLSSLGGYAPPPP